MSASLPSVSGPYVPGPHPQARYVPAPYYPQPIVWYPELHPFARRASDLDRDKAIEMLTAAAKRGQLGVEEHMQRVDGALHAKTVGDLVKITNDLVAGPTPVPFGLVPVVKPRSPLPMVSLVLSAIGVVTFPLIVFSIFSLMIAGVSAVDARPDGLKRSDRKLVFVSILLALVSIFAGILVHNL